MGGEIPSNRSNVIDFVTIMSTGNAIDFGDLTVKTRLAESCSNSTRALYAGGETQDSNALNTIAFITIATLGNAHDFGDMTSARMEGSSTSDSTRGVFAGGNTTGPSVLQNVIDFGTDRRSD